MQKMFYMLSDNQLLIIGIVAFIFGILLLSYLLTLILSSRKHKKSILKEESNKEEVNNSAHLEQVLNKMQETIDLKKEIDDVALFEKEQEENAVISYQELVEAAKKDFPEFTYPTKSNTDLEPLVVGNATINNDRPEKKFKSSVFISPIYGVKEELEQTIENKESEIKNYEPLSINYDENNEKFLEELKNFRNNL